MANPTEQPNILYLIDGHAQIFRAYYAIRGGMSSPITGEPTQAVFAFAGMLFKLFDQYDPTHVAMAVDMPGKTFRDEIYSEYKANRDPPPDDFHSQEQRIFEMTRLWGIPIIGAQGAEADDVIATWTHYILAKPHLADLHLRIVSRDKDLEQLLGQRVCLFDIHKDETISVETLMQQKGIRPGQVVDVLALMGDKVDNIPGVDGVGPKTAAKLINQFGSIDGVLANLDQIKGKRRQQIEAASTRLSMNHMLVTLKTDVPIAVDIAQSRVGSIDVAGLRQFFETMGFRRHQRNLEQLAVQYVQAEQVPMEVRSDSAGASQSIPSHVFGEPSSGRHLSVHGKRPSEPTIAESLFEISPKGSSNKTHKDRPVLSRCHTAAQCAYLAITTHNELEDLIKGLCGAPMISVDTETIGLSRHAPICGLSFAWKPNEGVYVPIKSPIPQSHLDQQTVLNELRGVLENPELRKCGHNLKYDALVLRHAGITLRGIAFDSMIASQLLGNSAHNLDHLARTQLNHSMIPISQLIGPRGSEQTTIDQIPLEQVVPYAAEDADIALQLYEMFSEKLSEESMGQLAAVEMPLVEVLADIESNGIRVDPDELLRQRDALTNRIDTLREQIHNTAGAPFNLDSPKQLAEVLFKKLGLPISKRKKTGPSTDVEVLERLASREDLPAEKILVPQLMVEYRQLSKLVNTYLTKLRHAIRAEDSRIHASFVQLGAATGRLASSGPNLQNIPIRTDIGRQIRKAFVAEPGHVLIGADYSQIELRILAHLSQDPSLTEAFNQDMDIHTVVAAQVFGVVPNQVTSEQRARAKVINFGIIYGITAYGLARRIEGLDEKSAATLIHDYRQRFALIDDFMHECVAQALNTGYVQTMLGRRRRIEQINSGNATTRALGERLAINTVVQGSATGDLIKTAMVNLYRRIYRDKLPMKILVQIHDELILEAPCQVGEEQAQIVKEEMEKAMTLRVPLKVDVGIGTDWFSAKQIVIPSM